MPYYLHSSCTLFMFFIIFSHLCFGLTVWAHHRNLSIWDPQTNKCWRELIKILLSGNTNKVWRVFVYSWFFISCQIYKQSGPECHSTYRDGNSSRVAMTALPPLTLKLSSLLYHCSFVITWITVSLSSWLPWCFWFRRPTTAQKTADGAVKYVHIFVQSKDRAE